MRAKIITLKRARNLRRRLTKPEVLLWVRLRGREPGTPVFRRQHAIGPYILDFFCPSAKLAIEVDGASHAQADQAAHDAERDAWLEQAGIAVHRVSAAEILAAPERAADRVWRIAMAAPSVSRSAATDTSPVHGGGGLTSVRR